MRLFTRVGLVAVVSCMALVASAGAASAYQFLDGSGNPLLGGKFGDSVNFVNFGSIDLTATVLGNPTTNHCSKASIGAQINNNATGSTLGGYIRHQVYSGCDAAKIYVGNTPQATLSVTQGQTSTTQKIGTIKNIDILARSLGGQAGFDCEFRGQISVTLKNTNPMQIQLGRIVKGVLANNVLNLYPSDQPGSFTAPGFPCPDSGTVAGTFQYDTNSAASLGTPAAVTIG